MVDSSFIFMVKLTGFPDLQDVVYKKKKRNQLFWSQIFFFYHYNFRGVFPPGNIHEFKRWIVASLGTGAVSLPISYSNIRHDSRHNTSSK